MLSEVDYYGIIVFNTTESECMEVFKKQYKTCKERHVGGSDTDSANTMQRKQIMESCHSDHTAGNLAYK